MELIQEKRNRKAASKSLNGFFWMSATSSLQVVLRMLLMLILARLLTPADFAIVTIASMLSSFAQLFLDVGIGTAIILTKNLTEDHIRTGFTSSVLTGFFIAIVFLIINPFIAGFFNIPNLLHALNTIIWIFPIQMVSKISASLLQREMKFKKLAGNDVISYLGGYAVVGVPLAFMGFGYMSLIWASIVQTIIYSSLLFYYQPHKISLGINKTVYRELVSYGSKSMISNFFGYLAQNGDYVVVGRVLNAFSLGVYTRAYRLMDMVNTMIGSVLGKVLFPSFSKLEKEGKPAGLLLKKCYELTFIIFIPISGISFVLAKEIIHLLLGKNWNAAIPIFEVFSLGMFLRMCQRIGTTYTKSKKVITKNVYNQVLYFFLVVAGALAGVYLSLTFVAIFVSMAILINTLLITNLAIKNSDYTWSSLINGCIPYLLVNLPVLFIIYLWSGFIRKNGLSDLLVFSSTIGIFLLMEIALIAVNKRIVFRDNTDWITKEVFRKVPVIKKFF